jgi:alkylated DNA nucleotide flippase Atl1
VSVIIPCHRVVRGDGNLGGYRWGLGRKQELLARERQTASGAGPEGTPDSEKGDMED